MCSYRTYVPMIACLLIPGFELRAALHHRPRTLLRPAALAPLPGTESLLRPVPAAADAAGGPPRLPLRGAVTAAGEAAGVRPGMRLEEALATCPSLLLVERDALLVETEWEQVIR